MNKSRISVVYAFIRLLTACVLLALVVAGIVGVGYGGYLFFFAWLPIDVTAKAFGNADVGYALQWLVRGLGVLSLVAGTVIGMAYGAHRYARRHHACAAF